MAAAPAASTAVPTTPRWRRDLLIGLGAMAIAAALVLPQLRDGNVTVFLRVGRYAASRPYVERAFPHPVLTQDYGHDGQQFYVIAGTLPHPRQAQPYLDDKIRYRFRRILFPLLVSPFRRGPPLVWAMFGVNLLAIGAAAIALARLVERLGGNAWLGLLAAISPALVESLQGSLADGLAFALALWGIVVWRRSIRWGVVLFTLAALTRETSLVVPAACFLVADARQRKWLVVPPAVYGVWMLVVDAWVPADPGQSKSIWSDATAQLTIPFKGWVQVGLTSPSVVLGAVLLVAAMLAAWQLRRRLPEVSWWLVFDSILLVCSNLAVAERPFNLARVSAMALPALVLAWVDRTHAGRPPTRRERRASTSNA